MVGIRNIRHHKNFKVKYKKSNFEGDEHLNILYLNVNTKN